MTTRQGLFRPWLPGRAMGGDDAARRARDEAARLTVLADRWERRGRPDLAAGVRRNAARLLAAAEREARERGPERDGS